VKLSLSIVLAVFVASAYTQSPCYGKKAILTENGFCNTSPYYLVFEDNFDDDSLDAGRWNIAYGVIRDFKHTIARQWFSSKNIEVSNGLLKLKCERDTLLNKCYFNGTDTVCEDFYFSTAQIDTKEKFGYGKFEMRCRIAKGKGVASSFWTFGDELNEIDIFEFENEKNVLNKFSEDKSVKVQKMNVHTDYDGDGKSESCSSHYKGIDFSAEFHVFSLIWTPHKIEWFVDDKKVRTTTLFSDMLGKPVDCNGLTEGHEYIINRTFPVHPMSIIVDNVIQSNKEAPDDQTEFPVIYEIDWIRYYKQIP
jgi:beta-glucanase (GH16 family)